MAASLFSAWSPEVLPWAPGAPDGLIVQAVRSAAREFCERTRAWVLWLDPATAGEGVGQELDFELPSKTELVRIEQVTVDGRPLDIDHYREAPADPALFEGDGKAAMAKDTKVLALTGNWAGAEAVQVQVSLMPAEDSVSMDTTVASRFRDAIASGARFELLSLPGVPFSNERVAGQQRDLFEKAIAAASVRAYMGFTRRVPHRRQTVRWC